MPGESTDLDDDHHDHHEQRHEQRHEHERREPSALELNSPAYLRAMP